MVVFTREGKCGLGGKGDVARPTCFETLRLNTLRTLRTIGKDNKMGQDARRQVRGLCQINNKQSREEKEDR